MKRFSLLILVAVALSALPALAQSQQDEPSLGALSQQAKEKKAAKVLTEDDVSSAQTTPAEPAATEEDKDKKPVAVDPEDERSDVDRAADDVKKWTHEEESLKNKLATLQQKEADEPSEFRKQMYRDAYNNQQTTLGELAEKRAKAEKELADARAKEAEEGPKPKKAKKAPEAAPDQSTPEQPPQ